MNIVTKSILQIIGAFILITIYDLNGLLLNEDVIKITIGTLGALTVDKLCGGK